MKVEKENVFYNKHIPTALRQARQNGRVATLPDLISERLLASRDDKIWDWYTTSSEENSGRTKANSSVVLVGHGELLWTPERIEKAYEDKLTDVRAGKINGTNEFSDLVEGKLPDGRIVPVLQFKEFDELSERPQDYYVIFDQKTFKNLPSGMGVGH